MSKQINLTEGNIINALVKLAIPIMGTSFLHMAYNLIDMIWIGRVGSDAVAAVGTAGFYMWFSMALILIPKTGCEVLVAQAIGKKDQKDAKISAGTGLLLTSILAVLYALIMVVFRHQLIGFLNVKIDHVNNMAEEYLFIVSFSMVFNFINQVFTGIINGYGNSSMPFKINTIGLILNMILDPILIFGLGPFNTLGVKGAAFATVLSQIVVTIIFLLNINKIELFNKFNIIKLFDKNKFKNIMKIGIPIAFQSGLFTFFTMLIARIIADWGPVAIAVQKVGSQIESISWMTASGFSVALSTFIGQNYGAGNRERIIEGYKVSIIIMSCIGILASLLFVLFPSQIFSFFIPEEKAILIGIDYLIIIGISQLFLSIEITNEGAFRGFGKTLTPSLIIIIFTGLRVPIAYFLSNKSLLGLNGIWWSISLTTILKGSILTLLFINYYKNKSK